MNAKHKAENPSPGGKKQPSVKDAEKLGRMELLRRWQEKWEALEDCRIREEELADAGLPVHSLIPMRVRLSSESLAIVTELRRMAAQELLKQNAAVEHFTGRVPCEKDNGEGHPENPLSDGSNKQPTFQVATVKELDRTTMLRALCLHNWDALQLCDVTEQELADKGLPVHALIFAKTRLIAKQVEIVMEWRRSDAQVRFKQLCSGEGLSPAALSDAAKQAQEILKQFSRKDRRMLRQILDHG